MLAVSHTYHPCGEKTVYLFGMPQPSVNCTAKEINKAIRKHAEKARNLPKKGGAAYEEEANEFVEECKNFLTLER